MNLEHHPCFSAGAKHKYGRIHLPVAPKCNMQCNYCNRDFECVNESRPGVTSTVLRPRQAADYLDAVLEKIKNIAVVGIAGPGDPFANGVETMKTLRLVRERHPEMMLCLATNGLELAQYVDEIEALKISHVTVTVNAVDPEISRRIYAWARVDKRVYRGLDAARIILQKQLEGIAKLKEKGVIVKINTVVIPGINDEHVVEIAKRMAELKADIMNCIPLYHVAGTPFASLTPPSGEKIKALREKVKVYLPQMGHCSRCRADAAGLIGEGQSEEIRQLLKKASGSQVTAKRPYVAVASREGIFVNQHLGEAGELWIFGMGEGKPELVERRFTPSPGVGDNRWQVMINVLHDCNTVLVSGIGPSPQQALERADIRIVVMEGLVQEGVEAVLTGQEIPRILLRTPGRCGIGLQCSGSGTGCG
ncbi:MAG: nitrogenase cofactor biosynthesis protein NifB [Deltaproteobacteria bacterium]|nr:nitrogenase cofactor biosynthesis protein NifB [Deltaproteobacteria bacterium]